MPNIAVARREPRCSPPVAPATGGPAPLMACEVSAAMLQAAPAMATTTGQTHGSTAATAAPAQGYPGDGTCDAGLPTSSSPPQHALCAACAHVQRREHAPCGARLKRPAASKSASMRHALTADCTASCKEVPASARCRAECDRARSGPPSQCDHTVTLHPLVRGCHANPCLLAQHTVACSFAPC